MRESERQFRLLVDGVTDYALFMLDPNGIVTSWNAGAERIKGYTADEIIGQHFSRFYTESERAAGVPTRALQTAMDGRAVRSRKLAGAQGWHAVLGQCGDRSDPGRSWPVDWLFQDYARHHERRDAQLAMEKRRAQRAHAQKMEALGQLTGGVAHDFNNLLMVVSGHIQTIKKAVAGDPKIAQAADAIAHAAQRGETLTRQLLTFSRRQTINPSVLEVGERVEELHKMLANFIGGSIKLITTIGPEVWPIKVDASELELALVNLVLNARDAMSKGGVVTITAENVNLSRSDTQAGIEGEFVALRVRDTGCGIAPDVLPKVFDPFFTTKETGKGSGLGLSQVHGFVHQSGGTAQIESELGRGTVVTIYLPRSHERTDALRSEPQAENAVGGTALLVEDNPEVLGVSKSMLEQLGYAVRGVPAAAAALEAIGEQSFDLVVSDIVMPGVMDGTALARAIRVRKPDLPVLLITGYSTAAGRIEGEFAVMRKPFQLSDLSRAITRLIAGARQPPNTNVVRLRDARTTAASKPEEK